MARIKLPCGLVALGIVLHGVLQNRQGSFLDCLLWNCVCPQAVPRLPLRTVSTLVEDNLCSPCPPQSPLLRGVLAHEGIRFCLTWRCYGLVGF